MSYYTTIIEPGSTPETWVRATHDRKPTLDFMQRTVGGPIQEVPHWDHFEGKPAWAVALGQGKLHGLLPNPSATKLWANTLGGTTRDLRVDFDEDTFVTVTVLDGLGLRPDFLVGPVLVISADTIEELEAT